MAKIEYLESVDEVGTEHWAWAERMVRDIETREDGGREGWIYLDNAKWAVECVSRRNNHWVVIGELVCDDAELEAHYAGVYTPTPTRPT